MGDQVNLALKKHPHGRGEDTHTEQEEQPTLETPPRAWGRLIVYPLTNLVLGNTPTGVGKTGQSRVEAWATWKHPHGRGEDFGGI